MTDNTQELREIAEYLGCNADELISEIMKWHNKQTLELLDRLEGRARGAFDYEADIEEYAEDVLTSIEVERNKIKESK